MICNKVLEEVDLEEGDWDQVANVTVQTAAIESPIKWEFHAI